MPTEDIGTVMVHGRFGSLQVADDAIDTEVTATAGATHAEIHQETQFQRIFYSLTGGSSTWKPLPPGAKDSSGTAFRVALGTATSIYFRKARQIRHVSFRPGFSGMFRGNWDASSNLPALANGTGHDKAYYYVSVAGTVDFGAGNIAFLIGDWVTYIGGTTNEWQKATEDPREGICDDVIGKVTVTFTED